MLFHVTWTYIDTTEESDQRSLDIFQAWQPPAGADFKGFYGNADGSGGVAIVEIPDAATLARTIAPFTPWMQFTATVILPIEESAAISGEAIAFREGIG